MIAKIKSGQKFYGAANYNQKKVDAGQARVLYQNGFVNTRPATVADTLQFLSGSRVKKPVFHASLSFAKSDEKKLDDQKVVDIAKEYMERMGYKNQPMIIYRHYDTKHPHVHVLTSRVDVETGRKINEHFEGLRSKEITDHLEIKYDLTVSDKQKLVEKEIVLAVQSALKKGKPEDVAFLNKALKSDGSNVGAKVAGKGLVYFKIDEEGKRNSRSYKSSLYKDFGLDYTRLKATFQENRADRIYVRNAVIKVLQDSQKLTPKKFAERLKGKQIETTFRKGTKGFLGVNYTYKQHTYNGSDLDRSLSWNKTKLRLDLPGESEYTLRNKLVASAKSGELIKIKLNGNRVDFDVPDPDLKKRIDDMNPGDGIDLVRKHNDFQKNLGGASGHHLDKLLAAFGEDVDEFLRKRRKGKSVGEERRLRL